MAFCQDMLHGTVNPKYAFKPIEFKDTTIRSAVTGTQSLQYPLLAHGLGTSSAPSAAAALKRRPWTFTDRRWRSTTTFQAAYDIIGDDQATATGERCPRK